MIPQVAHRLPQILLRAGAENLRAGALCFRPFRPKEDAATPEAVFGAAQGESDVYGLSVKANRGQVVDDRISRLLLTTATWAAPARTQTQTIGGTIVDARSGLPIPDASITVEGSNPVARSGTRGEFLLNNVPGTTARLRITRIGYQVATIDAGVGDHTVRVSLTELAVKLDAVVVTGTAGGAQTRALGNAVGDVEVAKTLELSGHPAKLQDMVSASVPGVRIMRASGGVGSGGTTRIRGSGSLSLSNEPLIYIDGVRSNNQAAAFSLAFNGAQEQPSRVNDLDPEEIESIEILKGPSAATIYGTEASNGVIQIITKRGRAGRPTFDVHGDAGVNWLMNPDGRYPSNYYIGRDGAVHEYNVLSFLKTHGFTPYAEGCPQPFQLEGDKCKGSIFSNGHPVASGASISGGTDQLRYFFSVDFNRDQGYLDYNWQNKYNGR